MRNKTFLEKLKYILQSGEFGSYDPDKPNNETGWSPMIDFMEKREQERLRRKEEIKARRNISDYNPLANNNDEEDDDIWQPR